MPSESPSSALIQGYAYGALIMTFFGTFWGMMTMFGVTSRQRIILIIVALVVTVPLVYFSISLLREAKALPTISSPEGETLGTTMRRGFAIVGVIEFVLIAITSTLVGRANRSEFIPLVIALIVGIHFLPLAAIFHVSVYYLTGTVMTLLAAVALVAMLFGRTVGGPYGWSVVVGLGNAAILWLTAVYVLSIGRQYLNA